MTGSAGEVILFKSEVLKRDKNNSVVDMEANISEGGINSTSSSSYLEKCLA